MPLKQSSDLLIAPPADLRAQNTVGAYVVTFRRPRLLAESLRALQDQTHPLQQIVVVNNDPHSDVGSLLVRRFPEVAVATAQRNTGSAGGFAAALRLAYDAGMTWAWLMDDDVVPFPDALAELLAAHAVLPPEAAPVGILAPLQVSPRAVFGVSLWRYRLVDPPVARRDGADPYPVDVAYWAGMLVHRRVIEEIGFPRSDFFRCFADYEYCLRARTAGFRIFAVPISRVRHDPGSPTRVVRLGRVSFRPDYPPSRNYYHVRNAAYTTRFVLRSPVAMLYHALRQVRLSVGDLLYEDRKAVRVQLRLQGLVDGFRGRLGRREDLE